MDRQRGTVKFYNPVKGFGFIITAAHKDLFVHQSAIREHHGVTTLEEGDTVEFDIVKGVKGESAYDVVWIA